MLQRWAVGWLNARSLRIFTCFWPLLSKAKDTVGHMTGPIARQRAGWQPSYSISPVPPVLTCCPGTPSAPARSRTFQRFAIRSSAMMEEMAKKSAEHKAQLGQTAAEKGGHFWKVGCV